MKRLFANSLARRCNDMERRAVSELRASSEQRTLEGYAAKFGTEARIADFTETIKAGAFQDSLSDGRDVLALVDHDPSRLLARTKTGTLELREDQTGLWFRIQVPETTTGNDVLALAKRGDLGGMSFGFMPGEERWTGNRRELLSVDLREISVAQSWPAYPETSVQARSKTPRLNRVRLFLETVK